MTKRQRETLDFIIEFTSTKGYSPSYTNIGEALKVRSLATVFKHVDALARGGCLDKQFNQTRALRVSPEFIEEYRRRKVANDCGPTRRCPKCKGAGFIGKAVLGGGKL